MMLKTTAQVIKLLEKEIKEDGPHAVARRLKMTPQYLFMFRKGNRELSEKVGARLGYKKQIRWTPI